MKYEGSMGINGVRFVDEPPSPSTTLPDIGEIQVNFVDDIDVEMGDATIGIEDDDGQSRRGEGNKDEWNYSYSREDFIVKTRTYLHRQYPMIDVKLSMMASKDTYASVLEF